MSNSKANQNDPLRNEEVATASNTKKAKKTGKKRVASNVDKTKYKKIKRETEPVVDVAVIKVSPTVSATKLFSILLVHAIPVPSMASPSLLVAAKARPDLMHQIIQQMVICLIEIHSPQAQNRDRLSVKVSKKDAAALDVPPGLLNADYVSKVEWVTRQIKDSRNQTGRLNILESYYHDFIKAEAHAQDTSKVTRTLSRHAIAKDFAQQVGIRGMSDTNITKYEYLWSMLSNIRSLGIQSLILYRNAAMNTLLKDETSRPINARLMISEVEEWGTLIEDIAQHLKASCVEDVDTKWPTHRWKFLAEKILFETNCIEPLANAPPKATQVDTYGYKGYSDFNRSWALMTPSVGPARPLAITSIEEKSYLGIMPGKIRFGGVCSPRAVVGPDGLWLDLEGEEGCLAKIPETTSIDQCNVNVAWEYTEDEMVPGSKSVRVLVFASRKIEIFQEVWRLRW